MWKNYSTHGHIEINGMKIMEKLPSLWRSVGLRDALMKFTRQYFQISLSNDSDPTINQIFPGPAVDNSLNIKIN
jgi:hypothetical protein